MDILTYETKKNFNLFLCARGGGGGKGAKEKHFFEGTVFAKKKGQKVFPEISNLHLLIK